MNISATILAAGSSSRMGKDNKLLLPIHGKPIINHVCDAVTHSKVKPVVVVTGYQNKKVEDLLPESIDRVVYNKEWENGMAGSIGLGISSLPDTIDGNMIILGDMPLLTTEMIDKIADQFLEYKGKKIIYPVWEGVQYNPVIFPKIYFNEILTSQGDQGCKILIERLIDSAIGVPVDSSEVIFDCDTKDDYSLLISSDIKYV